ncbi:P-loop NTPase [Methanoplanus limicola]|uniref:Cobyrinic acid ac-diamide synthase n=1 Tax=Methanoplanus limicola DSM 2279 TaxID=937775 RepID=H1YXJ1_9EURY|nr:ATP-binding protein [Methanoplanus limicola]EHQ34960.1 Cobyrinic acid ac-diamide synthase [Methanoplanus limicola DSM 2279]
MKIAVASGKGGTGKSTVSVNLAYTLALKEKVVLADCDVEEPNLHLFFNAEETEKEVRVPLPAFDMEKCTLCGDCARFCNYGALIVGKEKLLFLKEMCHSCGGCRILCPASAVSETEVTIGRILTSKPTENLTLITGILNIGEIKAPEVIKDVKITAEKIPDSQITILDSPPGTACSMVETVDSIDFSILVAESTPFGMHDIKLAAEVVKERNIPACIVINRSDGQDGAIEKLSEEMGIPILMRIPFEKEIARIQGNGEILSAHSEKYRREFLDLFERIKENTGGTA